MSDPELHEIVGLVRRYYDAHMTASTNLNDRSRQGWARPIADSLALQAESEETIAAQFGVVLARLERYAARPANPHPNVIRTADGGAYVWEPES